MISKNDEKITVVISSCDKYEEAWYPFFYLFRKYWVDCEYNVVLNTETKQYNEFNVTTINRGGKWSERLNKVLNSIETPYVILLLEDFFFQGRVDNEEINKCVNIMEQEPNIACFYFKNIHCNKKKKIYYDRYLKLEPTKEDDMYVINFMAGLWRKSVLMEILDRMQNSSPWDIEVHGYKFCKEIVNTNLFFCSNRSYYDELDKCDVFPYLANSKAGIGITRSKWLWNTKRFLKKEGAIPKFSSLKTMSYFEFIYREDIKPFMFRTKQFFIRRIKKFR